jgi:heptosyltransferase II
MKVIVGGIMREKILVCKTGWSEVLDWDTSSRQTSLGDVLRTTCILPALKGKHITWVTDERAFPLLKNNPYIDVLLRYDFDTVEQLRGERFDTIINLEKTPGLCTLVNSMPAREKFGYMRDSYTGEIKPYRDALNIISVSFSSKAKKQNQKSFQELLYESINQEWFGEEYVLHDPKEPKKYDVGLNTLVGQKWKSKAWSMQNWDELEEELVKRGFSVGRQDKLPKETLNNLEEYIRWISSCGTIISNDSLGLHIGISLKKPFIGIFGPTSTHEVHDYHRGVLLQAKNKPSCVPCHDPNCKLHEGIIDKVTVSQVLSEFEKLKNKIKK